MTVDDVLERILAIVRAADDDEEAHILEDRLRRDVLHAIAHGTPHAAELAALALSTEAMDFQRWYA